MIQSKMRYSANEQAKELITIFYPGTDVIQNFSDFMDGDKEDWRWERAVFLSIKCCEKIIEALESQRIQSLDVNEYWENVKQILEQK